MPGGTGSAPGVCSACGEQGRATDSFCEACGTELTSLSVRDGGDTATAKLGRAVAPAQRSGSQDTAKLLAMVVDAGDAASGTVRLKKNAEDAGEMALDTRSTKTVRTSK